jgi:hypothetical protein
MTYHRLPITYYLFQAKVFCAQKTLAWKPITH